MRLLVMALIISLLSGCCVVGKSDEELRAEVDELKAELRKKDVEIFELNQSLGDSRYTTWKFCSASEGWFWFDFFCYPLDKYPGEWKRAGPIEWGRVGALLSLPVISLGLLFGVLFMAGTTLIKEFFSNKKVSMMEQYRGHVLAAMQEEMDEATRLVQSIDALEDREVQLMVSVDELNDRKNSLIDDLEDLDEKIKNRKSSLGGDKEESKSEGDDDDESDLF